MSEFEDITTEAAETIVQESAEQRQKRIDKAAVDAIVAEQAKAVQLTSEQTRLKLEARNAKNKALVKLAFDNGINNATAIGKEISMTPQGVARYANELGISLRVTKAEKRRKLEELQQEVAEEEEKYALGLKRPDED